jgi:hypothetical protein
VTECESQVDEIFVGDGSTLYVFLKNHGTAVIVQANVNWQTYMAMATSALVAGRSVRIRYTADNADCTTWNSDIEGFWLL